MARFKQGFEGGELGVSAGYLRGDAVLVLDGIVDLGKLDLYGELVGNIFSKRSLSPNASEPAQAALGDVALRAVLGARIKPTSKLTLTPELFYNGLGSFEREDYVAIANSQRFSIGEIYNLGRIYAGLVAAWEVHPLLTLRAVTMANLHDPSGLLSLGAVYSVSDNVSAIAGGLFVVALLGIWIGVWRYGVGDARFERETLKRHRELEEGQSLNDLGLEAKAGPDFRHLE